MGMKEEVLKMIEMVVNQVYNNGLQFCILEVIIVVGIFWVSYYLWVMVIWVVYGLLEGFSNLFIVFVDDEVFISDFY